MRSSGEGRCEDATPVPFSLGNADRRFVGAVFGAVFALLLFWHECVRFGNQGGRVGGKRPSASLIIAQLSWIRAFAWFAVVGAVAWAAGVLGFLVDRSFSASTYENAFGSTRESYVLLGFALVAEIVCFWILWGLPGWTAQHGRKQYPLSNFIFSIFWGFSYGLIGSSVFVGLTVWTKWLDHDAAAWGGAAFFLAFFASSAMLQGIVSDFFWDVYVSPQSETSESLRKKIVFCHLPTAALSHGFLVYCPRQLLLFACLHILGVMGACMHIRFPAFWDTREHRANDVSVTTCCVCVSIYQANAHAAPAQGVEISARPLLR